MVRLFVPFCFISIYVPPSFFLFAFLHVCTSQGVDFYVGKDKNISRRHGLIRYDFTRSQFVLEVLGKNGVHVDGKEFFVSVLLLVSEMSAHS